MAEDSLSAFLQRREKELTAQIAALQGQINPRLAELAQVREMIQRIASDQTPAEPVSDYSPFFVDRSYATMTIQQLVIQALRDGYSETGATAGELRDFISRGFRREIVQSSLRPQLHRLKANKQLKFDAASGRWKL